MKGPGLTFWIAAVVVVVLGIYFHVSGHHESYFSPVVDVTLPLDERATSKQCFEGSTVRGGRACIQVTGISDLGVENGIHRAYANVEVDFDLDPRYDGWGWSRFERPTLAGFIAGPHDVTSLGTCSTDYQHNRCRFRALVPLVGDTPSLHIQLREAFR